MKNEFNIIAEHIGTDEFDLISAGWSSEESEVIALGFMTICDNTKKDTNLSLFKNTYKIIGQNRIDQEHLEFIRAGELSAFIRRW